MGWEESKREKQTYRRLQKIFQGKKGKKTYPKGRPGGEKNKGTGGVLEESLFGRRARSTV